MNKIEIVIYKVNSTKAGIILKQLIVVNTNAKCYSYSRNFATVAVFIPNQTNRL